eukprot:9703170-Alexandrium_andersonii.AAC.1
MSASLVGSEMCIRDSAFPARQAATSECCASLWVAETAPRASNSPSTVSYTHLTLPTICSV